MCYSALPLDGEECLRSKTASLTSLCLPQTPHTTRSVLLAVDDALRSPPPPPPHCFAVSNLKPQSLIDAARCLCDLKTKDDSIVSSPPQSPIVTRCRSVPAVSVLKRSYTSSPPQTPIVKDKCTLFFATSNPSCYSVSFSSVVSALKRRTAPHFLASANTNRYSVLFVVGDLRPRSNIRCSSLPSNSSFCSMWLRVGDLAYTKDKRILFFATSKPRPLVDAARWW